LRLKLPDGADKIALILALMVTAVGSDPARVVSAIAESLRNRISTLLTSKFVDENLSKRKVSGTPALPLAAKRKQSCYAQFFCFYYFVFIISL
jgi:hypothetical protein